MDPSWSSRWGLVIRASATHLHIEGELPELELLDEDALDPAPVRHPRLSVHVELEHTRLSHLRKHTEPGQSRSSIRGLGHAYKTAEGRFRFLLLSVCLALEITLCIIEVI